MDFTIPEMIAAREALRAELSYRIGIYYTVPEHLRSNSFGDWLWGARRALEKVLSHCDDGEGIDLEDWPEELK